MERRKLEQEGNAEIRSGVASSKRETRAKGPQADWALHCPGHKREVPSPSESQGTLKTEVEKVDARALACAFLSVGTQAWRGGRVPFILSQERTAHDSGPQSFLGLP